MTDPDQWEVTMVVMEKDLKRLVVHMIAAASAYQKYAKGDAFKKTRVADFKKAANLGKTMLRPYHERKEQPC